MNYISTAVIGKTFGFEGYVFVYSLSGEIEHLKGLKTCKLVFSSGDEIEVKVENVKTHGDNLLMRFFGYETLEKAKFLAKAVMMIDRKLSPPLKKGEVYVADLIGMVLVHDEKEVGRVVATSDGAQSLLLHVLTFSDNKTRLVPYMKPFVDKACIDTKSIELHILDLLEV